MNIQKFEDCIAWQKSQDLVIEVYGKFKNIRDFSFRDQIQRAVVSIMNNIAEGFERNTNKELVNFLYIAKGSSGEVRSMLRLTLRLTYISASDAEILIQKSEEVARILSGLIKKLQFIKA